MTPLSTVSPAACASCVFGRTPTPATMKSSGSGSPVARMTRSLSKVADGRAEAEADAVLLVEMADERADLDAHRLLQRNVVGRDDGDLDFARAQATPPPRGR